MAPAAGFSHLRPGIVWRIHETATYLLLSYLELIVILGVGVWFIDDYVMHEELPQKIMVRLYHLKNKIVTGAIGQAWMTHLCDTGAVVASEGKVEPWEDVRLILLDDKQEPLPGHVYGKVTRVKPRGDGRCEVLISFTSVPPEIYQKWRKNKGAA